MPARPARRGAVLVMAVACLAVVSLIAATMLEGAMRARRQWRLEQFSRQIDCLLDAAERHGRRCVAEGRLEALVMSIDLSATTPTPSHPVPVRATVRILFTPDAGDRCRVQAVVEWPPEGPVHPPLRRSRSFSVAQSPEAPAIPAPRLRSPAGRGKSPPGLFPGMKTFGFRGCSAPGTSSLTCNRLFVHSLLAPT